MNFLEGTIEIEGEGVYFNEGQIKVLAPKAFEAKLRPHAGKKVFFGVRPEDMYVMGYGEPVKEGISKIKSKVEIVEPMGSEIYAYMTTGKTPYIARLDAHVPLQLDEVKDLAIDMNKSHFFDMATENAII